MDKFQSSSVGQLILLRAVVGIFVIALTYQGLILAAGVGLVLCIWIDVAFGKIAKHKQWQKNQSDIQLEGFSDFICFVIAPCLFTLAYSNNLLIWACSTLFILAGIWRIARFNVEGLVSGSYEGLPVTYNGYLFPLLALVAYYSGIAATAVFAPGILIISALMVTRKIRILEL